MQPEVTQCEKTAPEQDIRPDPQDEAGGTMTLLTHLWFPGPAWILAASRPSGNACQV